MLLHHAQVLADLVSMLAAESRMARLHDDKRAYASQLQETVRALEALDSSPDVVEQLLRVLSEDYDRRRCYVKYLVSTRQSLITTLSLLERNTEQCRRALEYLDQVHISRLDDSSSLDSTHKASKYAHSWGGWTMNSKSYQKYWTG